MAEPPSGARPPPIPGRRTPPPPPVPKGVKPKSQSAEAVDEDAGVPTKPVAVPDKAALVEEVTEIMAREVEALGLGDNSDGLADVHLRLAVLKWDVLEDPDESLQHLALAEQHPMTGCWMLAHAISANSGEQLDNAQSAIEASTLDTIERQKLLRQVTEAWLYRFGDSARAADVARAALDISTDTDTAVELRYLLCLALAAGEEWSELSTVLNDAALSKGAAPELWAEAVHVAFDRLDDADAASDLLDQLKGEIGKLAEAPETERLGFALLGLALEVTATRGEVSSDSSTDPISALLRRRIQVLQRDVAAVREAAATRYILAERLREVGDSAAAAELFSRLAGEESEAWGARLARMVGCQLAEEKGEWSRVVEGLRQLAVRPGSGQFAGTYVRRAAEVLDARVDDAERALELWRKVLSEFPGDLQILRAIERLLLQQLLAGEASPLIRYLQEVAGKNENVRASALRRASAVAESRAGDISQATRLRLASIEGAETADVEGLVDLARLHRRGHDRAGLADAYRTLATAFREDTRSRALVACAAGAVELSRGRDREAEEALKVAAADAPQDAVARSALAVLYRRARRWAELAAVLGELGPLLADEGLRVENYRELGRLCKDELKDATRARDALEKVLEIDANDAKTLHALAELYDRSSGWDKAVELRQRAVDAFEDDATQVLLLMEIGDVENQRRENDDAALAAYQRAFAIDSSAIESLVAQARIYRQREDSDELLRVLRIELELGPQGPRRLEILLEIAALSAAAEDDAEAALDAYREALKVDPENPAALAGVERIARAQAQWQIIAEAFRGAPATAANLKVLGEALEQQESWSEYADVRLQELELASSDVDKARMAEAIAATYEEKLEDAANAIALYQRALAFDANSAASQSALARLLEESERWPDLASALEMELATSRPEDTERQLGLLLRIGAIRRDKLTKPAEAALSYEAVLELEPQHVPALESLEELYELLDREKDLLRVLEARAEATEDSNERAQLYGRVAEVKDRRNDAEGAVAAYQRGFAANPSSRETFTAMEKLCYKNERWNDAMDLYDLAIEVVEEGNSRAYRLGDLYARRGQVQLQYLHELGEAAASYLRVIELDPENDTAVKFLESIFSQQGDWVGLISAYEKRAELTRDDDRRLETLRRAARVAGAKLKDPAEAARIYELIIKADNSDREALDALERFYERAQDWGKLVSVLKKRLASAPAGDAATALLKRVAQICEEGLRDEQRAIEHYLRILEIAPGNKEALEALGRIYESTEQWAEFIDVTRRQIRITTERNVKALLYFKCGSVMEAKFGKEADAIRYYDAAIKTSPSCLPAVHGLRDLYRRRKDWPRVIQTLELEVKLWQDDKERAGVFAQIGRIYSEYLKQPERAIHYYESALAVDPECLPANKALFEHYFELEDWDRAQPLAQALAQKAMREGDPTQRSEFYKKRGIVARMTGDSRAAAESLVIALEIKPTNITALDELGALAKADPEAYDFKATYRELDKIYRKRDDSQPFMARVRVAEAVMIERDGDLDAAEELYAEANVLAPVDFAILSALVDLHANMRRWTHAVDAIVRFLAAEPPQPDEVRVRALMRQAELHADCEMDPHRAISVLKEVIKLDPSHQEAPYRLAQELYILGRYGEARAAVERVIQLAAAPGTEVLAETLARYYYYLGRIIEASNDPRASASQYRRAAEYDPGYAPPVLALAKRAADGGDQRQAETLLINAAHAAMETGGAAAAVPLQRGLARILLASGDRPAAIEAYRGILAVEPDGATDRVALAEIYAIDDLPKAISELKKVIDRDIHHAPAYRLLGSFYARTGEPELAARVLSTMEMLGFAEEGDRGAAAKARAAQTRTPLRRRLDEDLRKQFLLTDAVASPLGEVFLGMADEVAQLFPQPVMGENLIPVQTIEDPVLKVAVADLFRLYGLEAEIYVGENVPGSMAVVTQPRNIVVIDREHLTESDAGRRFLLAYALDGLRGNYSLLYSLGRRQRTELGSLLKSLILPESERAGPTNEFIKTLPKRAIKIIERLSGRRRSVNPDEWIDQMLAIPKRAGLFACDDFFAATRMIARLNGENLAVGQEATALGAVLGGADLVRFFLSDEYHRLREILSNPLPAPSP